MKKTVLTVGLAAAVMSAAFGETLRDYAPGKLPAAKNVKFAMSEDGVLSMDFGDGNLPGSRAWMRRHHDFIPVGKALKITMQVRTTGMLDKEAKVGFMVQALGENRKYLRSRIYTETFPAADFDGRWGTMEFLFKMPDPAKTPNWQEGRMLMITKSAPVRAVCRLSATVYFHWETALGWLLIMSPIFLFFSAASRSIS